MRQRILYFGLLILMGVCGASAQVVSLGVKGGIRFTDASGGQDESRPYIVGPSIEFRLPAHFAIEIDALYQRLGNTAQYHFFSGITSPGNNGPFPYPVAAIYRVRANSWEFPVLGKYYLRPRTAAWQPFIGTGWALRTSGVHTSGSVTTVDSAGAKSTSSYHSHYQSGVDVGAVFAAGVKYRVGRVAFAPEARYTRWGGSDSTFNRKNEAAVLLGITF
ncbi:MAG: outer membrane beta-barrel protein [Candidatus Solibacter usitatus]|nr:outer membrane beta-barrel protein [Candidatus Solibacter usitatus]